MVLESLHRNLQPPSASVAEITSTVTVISCGASDLAQHRTPRYGKP
jgi:hypothetical protein